MSKEIVPHKTPRALARQGLRLPAIIDDAGEHASRKFIEFFVARIRNKNTRAAYGRAVMQFFDWCEDRGLALHQIEPIAVSIYIESHSGSAPTVKQHLAAIRMLFDHLVVSQVVPFNPAHAVRGPRHVIKKGKTPVLTAEETRMLFDSIDVSTIVGQRDRALIGSMFYSFARVGAVVGMNVEDYYNLGKRSWLRLHEKGGKFHEVPVHHVLQGYLDAYIDAAGIQDDSKGPLFRTVDRSRSLTANRMHRNEVLGMIKRRAERAGISTKISPHTFRGTGITNYLENGGDLETAQAIAAHASPRTTKLYDRTSDAIDLAEIERIRV